MDFAAKAAVARVVGITTRLRIEAAKLTKGKSAAAALIHLLTDVFAFWQGSFGRQRLTSGYNYSSHRSLP